MKLSMTSVGSTALAVAIFAQPAYGQSAADAAAQTEQEQGSLGEIVVTATRRSENLQAVPVSVTAITGENLAASGVADVRNLTKAVPSFTGGRNYSVFLPNIRGVGSTGVSLGDEPNIALYVDGVYQPSSLANLVDLVEVDRVEVLRGPQGTLFGRNATGGLINIITPDPSFTARGKVAASYARFHGAGEGELKGYITGPISDTVAADLAVVARKTGDYIRDVASGEKYGGGYNLNFRSKLLFQPSDTSKFILSLGYTKSKDTAGNAVQPVNGNSMAAGTAPSVPRPTQPFEVALDLAPLIQVEAFNASLRTEFDLGEVSLETSSAYAVDKIQQNSDTDGSAVPIFANRITPQHRTFSQEVRLLSANDGPFQWILGGFYFHHKAWDTARLDIGGIANALVITPNAKTNALAGFAEGTYAVTDRLKVTLGGRYSWEKREFQTAFGGVPLFPAPAEYSKGKWTYRGIVKYEVTDKTNVYASYSTGFKSGVFNTYGASPIAVNPETIRAVEVGLKSDPLPWLRTNLSLFHYSYKDLQVVGRQPGSALYLLQNAASAKVKGAELEVQAAVSNELDLRFSGSVLDAKYSSFPNAQVFTPVPNGGNIVGSADVSGNNLVRAPKFSFSAGGQWRHLVADGEVSLSANVFHSSRVYYDFLNSRSQKPYTTLNAEIAYSTGPWRFSVTGDNLTDAKIYQQISVENFGDIATYERPLSVKAGVQYKF